MKTLHASGHLTPHGHSSYRGYDAIKGKLISLSPTGRVYTCECGQRFMTKQERNACTHKRREQHTNP